MSDQKLIRALQDLVARQSPAADAGWLRRKSFPATAGGSACWGA